MCGLPTWIRWIIVFVVGLSPILTIWAAGAVRRYLRRKLLLRSRSGSSELRRDRLARDSQRHRDDQRG